MYHFKNKINYFDKLENVIANTKKTKRKKEGATIKKEAFITTDVI